MPQPVRNFRNGRFQQNFIRVFALIFLMFLLIYTISTSDFKAKTNQRLQSLDISAFVKNAIHNFYKNIEAPKVQRKRKLILLWTDYFSASNWLPSAEDLKCPITECYTTSNRTLLLNSSAVILHWRNIDTSRLPKCVANETVQCPYWVLFNKEAPPHTNKDVLKLIQNKVRWIATYRKDSDLYAPYGEIVPKKIRSSVKTDFDANRRILCWLVSNCNTPSKREEYVDELRKYIEVDIYGKCGSKQCPHISRKDCYRWLSNRCMFYMSLENSICKDYTTEKLYNALSSDMVPVVMGRKNNYRHLPPDSFINAADFSSPKELAEYLVKVANNRTLYASYFIWKRYYEVRDQPYLWFCDLCQKLHDNTNDLAKQSRNLVSWWYDQAECTSWENL